MTTKQKDFIRAKKKEAEQVLDNLKSNGSLERNDPYYYSIGLPLLHVHKNILTMCDDVLNGIKTFDECSYGLQLRHLV